MAEAAGAIDTQGLTDGGFAGRIVMPDHDEYHDLRKVFNGMIDRKPGAIARCGSTADVAAAVKHAGAAGLPISIYGGGHAVTGHAVCDDALCIDLREMDGVEVDPDARIARIQGGARWGKIDAATQEHGLAVTGGRMSDTGIGGLALGSGSGWLERKLGLTCDNLRSVEIVTADGSVLRASEDENQELFWGTRGGGGNFGVVTEFELELHPIGPMVLGGMLMYPAPMVPDVLRHYRDYIVTAPDEVCGACALLSAPPEEFVPEPVRGQPILGMVLCYAGPLEDAEEGLRTLREFGPPAMDMVQEMPYVAVQQLINGGNPSGMRNYWTADFLAELPDEAIDVLAEAHVSRPSPMTQILVVPGGGAIARVPEDATAFNERKAPFNLHILSLWPDPAADEENIAFTRKLGEAMKPFAAGRAYLNFIGEEGEDRVKEAFGPETYARLQALKDRYDPQNLFRLNQNIKPTAS